MCSSRTTQAYRVKTAALHIQIAAKLEVGISESFAVGAAVSQEFHTFNCGDDVRMGLRAVGAVIATPAWLGGRHPIGGVGTVAR